jgi:tRNA A22 N-methylase
MSSFAELRQGLADSGYSIETESLVRDGHMIYQIIVCTYTGEKYKLSSAQRLLGPENIRENSELFSEYAAIHLRKLDRKIESKGGAGYDVSEDIELAKEIRNILKSEKTEDVKNGDSI